MSLTSIPAAQALSELDRFDTIIDARSESEFAEDRLPGAVNWPSLNDAERHQIGTEYKQVSPFAAKQRGAAMVARNVARHIETQVMDKPREWRPLVYCWRGGKRSGSLALVLDQIGYKVQLLEGGYKAYRRAVVADLALLSGRFTYQVLCGKTGSGKSRMLTALQRQGGQVLDLEALANHRGSVLGLVPGHPQPSQKQFDSRIWAALRQCDPARPVWIESESKKVGELRVPEALILAMRASSCLRLELPLDARVTLLMEDYDFFVKDVGAFCDRLDALRTLRGKETVERWQGMARAAELPSVVRELLLQHYDPVYLQSMQRNFTQFAQARDLTPPDGNDHTLDALATTLLRDEASRAAP